MIVVLVIIFVLIAPTQPCHLSLPQVMKAMEVTHRLGGVNYVFWGGREGYQSLLNTHVRRELDNFAAFLHMAVAHKKSLGATFQLLIEPKPREPTKHQYDYDAQVCLSVFLSVYLMLYCCVR
jgi:xylose isomerase